MDIIPSDNMQSNANNINFTLNTAILVQIETTCPTLPYMYKTEQNFLVSGTAPPQTPPSLQSLDIEK